MLDRTDADLAAIATLWLAPFEAACADGNADALSNLFVPDCWWRDLLAGTWRIQTVQGAEVVKALARIIHLCAAN